MERLRPTKFESPSQSHDFELLKGVPLAFFSFLFFFSCPLLVLICKELRSGLQVIIATQDSDGKLC